MPSRDIHSRDGGRKVRDFLSSIFATLLTVNVHEKPIYLISPWLSEFVVFDNDFYQFRDLFKKNTNFAENLTIRFSEILHELSENIPIRIITSYQESSLNFVSKFKNNSKIDVEIQNPDMDHQKAFLSELFYFEGSMNFTYSGVYKNKEKITCNAAYDSEGKRKIAEAYLEFDMAWDNLKP